LRAGINKGLPQGGSTQPPQPLGPVDEHGHPIPLEYQGAPVPKRMNKLGYGGAPGEGSLLFADPPAEQEALTEVAHAQEQRAITALRERQDSINGSGDGNGQHSSTGANGDH